MDYGKPRAQFEQADVAAKGGEFVGRKVTVKGKVVRIDVSDPDSAWVELEGGIRCHYGRLARMADGYEVGETVLVDGILKRCDKGDILLDPAVGRDPKAPFEPR